MHWQARLDCQSISVASEYQIRVVSNIYCERIDLIIVENHQFVVKIGYLSRYRSSKEWDCFTV